MMMMFFIVFLTLPRLGVLRTHGTVRTDRAVLGAEPVVLLAVHGILASPV